MLRFVFGICIGLLIAFFRLSAQEPFHYVIGEEVLAGVDVYGILQDQDANVWIASNNGLYRYDGYAFHTCPGRELSDISLFSLQQDRSGHIYCLNLSGQIFRVESDSLQLFFQIPDTLVAPLMSIAFDDQDELVVQGARVFKLETDHSVRVIFPQPVASLTRLRDGTLIGEDIAQGQLLRYRNGQLDTLDHPYPVQETHSFRFLAHGNQQRIIHLPSLDQYFVSPPRNGAEGPVSTSLQGDFSLTQGAIAGTGEVWASVQQGGMVVLDSAGKSVYGEGRILEKYLVTWQMEDREGNRWIGTKDRGILIIPNPHILDYSRHPAFKDSRITGLAAGSRGNVYVNTNTEARGGTVFRISPEQTVTELEVSVRGSEAEYFDVLGEERLLVAAGDAGGCWDLEKGELLRLDLSSVKDVCWVGEMELMWVNQNGLSIAAPAAPPSGVLKNILEFPGKVDLWNGPLATFRTGRSNCVLYEAAAQRIWVGTNRGLKILDAAGMREVEVGGRSIMARDLALVDGRVWVGTDKSGLYCFEGPRWVRHFDGASGLMDQNVRKLIHQDGFLYLMSRWGIQRMDLGDFSLVSFGPKDGLLPGAVRDFGVSGEDIWVYTLGGLQQFRFADLRSNTARPVLEVDSVRVNDRARALPVPAPLAYDQNKIEFRYIGKAFRHRGTLTYRYRLLGLDSTWQEKPYSDRSVIYNALPSGQFVFELEAVNEDGRASLPYRFPFSIAEPYWLKWWFWLGCIGLVIGVVSVIFAVRIRILRRSLVLEKKLKDSELVAIKAQMNPHFVFNVLNSFQDLIYQQDFRKTNAYLGKFAGLMRKTLEFSDRDAITLAEETELLEDYLDLEKLRFGEDFVVEISQELDDRDADALKIPSMLLQPYVENAIKHGLLHKSGRKVLAVRFRVQDDCLVCEIQDNGIGRAASAEIKKRREKYHQPFAATATQKRIDLMNQARDKPIGIAVEDLVNEAGEAAGTLVRVVFPV